MKSIIELQALGDKSVNPQGSKVLPSVAVNMFSLQCSTEGANKYPNCPFMRVSETGRRTHLLKDNLDVTTLKTYFGKTRQQLLSQLTNLTTKTGKTKEKDTAQVIANQAMVFEQMADPYAFQVKYLKRTELVGALKRWDAYKNCSSMNVAQSKEKVAEFLKQGMMLAVQ